MVTVDQITDLVDGHLSRVLLVAEAAMPESQFKAFRKFVLDEFGRKGLVTELEHKLVRGRHTTRQGED